jgi:hypothetical protein
MIGLLRESDEYKITNYEAQIIEGVGSEMIIHPGASKRE